MYCERGREKKPGTFPTSRALSSSQTLFSLVSLFLAAATGSSTTSGSRRQGTRRRRGTTGSCVASGDGGILSDDGEQSGGGERRAWLAWSTVQILLVGEQCGGGTQRRGGAKPLDASEAEVGAK